MKATTALEIVFLSIPATVLLAYVNYWWINSETIKKAVACGYTIELGLILLIMLFYNKFKNQI